MATSFEELYAEYLAGVWSYVRARVPEHHDAQDVTGDVFARALRSWPSYDPMKGTVPAWLFRIAHNTVVDWWRRTGSPEGRRETPMEVLIDDPAPDVDQPEGQVLRREAAGELHRAIAKLSEREQEAIALRFGGGLRAREVGHVLGISEAAAKMLVHRAVNKLRRVMTDE